MLDASTHALPRPAGLSNGRSARRADPWALRKPRRVPMPARKGRHALGASAKTSGKALHGRIVGVPLESREDSGAVAAAALDDTAAVSPARRWLSRSGIVGGSAISLAVGAVLGGVLEGVPHLLAPPAASGSFPVAGAGGGSAQAPAQLAAARTAAPDWQGLLTGLLPVTSVGVPLTAVSQSPSASSSGSGQGPVRAGGPPSGGAGAPVRSPSTPTPVSGAGASSPSAPTPACDSSCALMQTIGQTAAQVPGVGDAVSGIVSQVATAASGAPGAASAPGASIPGSALGGLAPSSGSGAVTSVTGVLPAVSSGSGASPAGSGTPSGSGASSGS
jgi:hypothetical protein